MSKLRIAITADTYPYASDVTNLVRAPFTARGLVDIINELGALPVVLPDVPEKVCQYDSVDASVRMIAYRNERPLRQGIEDFPVQYRIIGTDVFEYGPGEFRPGKAAVPVIQIVDPVY